MRFLVILLPLLLLLGATVVLLFVVRASRDAAGSATYADQLAERDDFIEHLRELAWQHRDLSPELSTIIIDEIATRHRQLKKD